MSEKIKEKNTPIINDLTQMKARQKGTVTALNGGHGMMRRLDAMGVRPGVHITKLSSQFMQGPVIVKAGSTQIALGFGIARKILVKLDIPSSDTSE